MSDASKSPARYFTNAGKRAILACDAGDVIGVMTAPDEFPLIGMGFVAGWTDRGLAVWRLIVHKVEDPGRWICRDGRTFAPLDEPADGFHTGTPARIPYLPES